jgi:hypothetical protein
MQDVSDSFLLQMAEVSGGLFGLFMVGMLFFVEIGFQHLGPDREAVVSYFRASARIVLLLFSLPLGVSLTLVVLDQGWSIALFGVLSLALVVANVDTAVRVRSIRNVTGSPLLVINEIVGTIAVALIVVLPWALGGIDPSRGNLTWAILVSFAAAFLSLGATLMSAFDLAIRH